MISHGREESANVKDNKKGRHDKRMIENPNNPINHPEGSLLWVIRIRSPFWPVDPQLDNLRQRRSSQHRNNSASL
jgi:hypothetical protein